MPGGPTQPDKKTASGLRVSPGRTLRVSVTRIIGHFVRDGIAAAAQFSLADWFLKILGARPART